MLYSLLIIFLFSFVNLYADTYLMYKIGSKWSVSDNGRFIAVNDDITTMQVEDIESNVTKPIGSTLTVYDSLGIQKINSSDNLLKGDYVDVNSSGEIGRRYLLFGIKPQMALGSNYTILLTEEGKVYSFGAGEYGQLGHGDEDNRTIPTQIVAAGENNITSIVAGDYHTLLLGKDGKVYSFGAGFAGRLGHGDTSDRNVPTQIVVAGENNITSIVAGDYHTLLLGKDGKVYSFGAGGAGQLGLGDTSDKNVPTQIVVAGENNITSIVAGYIHTLLLDKDGRVYSFGAGDGGELGHGDEDNRTIPTQIVVAGENNITSIVAGTKYTLLLGKDGKVYSFGAGSYGQLGHGDENNRTIPTQIVVAGENNITSIVADYTHSFLLDIDGKVYSFGAGTSGELGHGDTNNRDIPTQIVVAGENNITSISAGTGHTLLLDRDEKFYSFGYGGNGRLGHGDTFDQLLPKEIEQFALDFNITLQNVNLSENNITSILAYTSPDSAIENLYIYDYYGRGGYSDIFDGENNYTVPIFHSDNNFTFEFSVYRDRDDFTSSWFYNFSDGKLYPDNNGSDEFKREINVTNNIFTIDLSNSNWNYYKFSGNLINNEKNITDIELYDMNNFISFEQNLSEGTTTFDLNFSEQSDYTLKFITDRNQTWYYNFDTKKIESIDNYITTTITLNDSNLSADFDVSKSNFDDYHIDLNISLIDVNLSEHNITSIFVYTSPDETIENLYVYDYYERGGYNTLINLIENNYSVPIFYPDNNFTFEFYENLNGFETNWFYNFSNGKFYPDNNGSDEFKREINVTDSNFTIDLNGSNWNYYEFNGTLFDNTKTVTAMRLIHTNGTFFESNISTNLFDINFSEIGNYSLELLVNDSVWWYYDFSTNLITSTPNGSYITLNENFILDLNLSPIHFNDFISIPFYELTLLNTIDVSSYTKVVFNDTIDLIFATNANVTPNRLEVLDATSSTLLTRVINSNILSSLEISDAYVDKMLFSNDGTKLFLIGNYIEIIDISNPNAIVHLGTVLTGESSIFDADISNDDTTIYIPTTSGLKVFNVSNSTNPTYIGTYGSLSVGVSIVVNGDKIYIAEESSGIKIFDVNDLSNPISFIGDINRADNIALSNDGNTLFVLNYIGEISPAYNIKVVDVSDYTFPTVIETYNTLYGAPMEIVTSKFQPLLYITSEDDSANNYLEIVNISNPSTLVNYFEFPLNENSYIFPDIVDGYIGLIGYDKIGEYYTTANIYQFMPFSNDSTFISNPNYIDFGSVDIYSTHIQSVTITNNSLVTGIVELKDIMEPFSVYPTSCNLAPNESCIIDITYYPTTEGSHYNILSLISANSVNYFEVSGYSYNPYIYYDNTNEVDNIDIIDNTIINDTTYLVDEPFSDINYDFNLEEPISLTDESGVVYEDISFIDNFTISEGDSGETFFDINYGAEEGKTIIGSIDFFEDGTSKSIVSITDEFGDMLETSIDIPAGFETKIGQSGEILQTFLDEDGSFTELSTSPKGNVDINIKTADGKSLGFKAPVGTKVEVRNDGTLSQNLDTKDSKTKIEASKDGKTKVNIQTVDGDGVDLDLDIEANTEMRSDGSLIQKIENENAKTELQASKRAEVKAVIENREGISIQLNPPKNAQVKVNSDNSISITNQVMTNDGFVQSEMRANPDGSSSVEVNIDENERGVASKKLIYSTRKNISKVKLEVLLDEQSALSRTLRATKIKSGRVKATFSTRREFSFKRDENLRVINDNYNVVITPEVSAKFEENLYFNEDMDLKLSSGRANIKTIFSTRSQFSQIDREISDKLQSTRREFSIKANKSVIESSGKVSATLSEEVANQKLETIIKANQENGEVLADILLFDNLTIFRNTRSQKVVAKKLTYSIRKEFSDAKLEVIENSSNRVLEKVKLKATYSTRSIFSFKNSNLREVSEVTITPLSEDAKFEENIASNGERFIKLVEGEASININGITTQMVIDKNYDLPPLEFRDVEIDLTSIKNVALYLNKGWNLIASPIAEDISDKFIFGNYDVIWSYKNNKWFKNPNMIYYDEGLWIKSNVKQDINFTGEGYIPNLKIIPDKWALVGSGEKIENLTEFLENQKVKEIYLYQDGNWSNSKTIKLIEVGNGFWIEKFPMDANLTIKKGWNLLSVPVDENISDMSIFGNYKTIYTYKNGEWLQNSEIIEPKEGFWINSNEEAIIAFYGDEYSINVEDLSSGWSLIGGVIDLNKFNLNNLKVIWVFQNSEWKKIETIVELNLIKIGDGFWIKK